MFKNVVGRHVPLSHRPRSTNQRPSDGRAIGRMDDPRVRRGLEFGHDYPVRRRPPSTSAPPIVCRMLSPGNPSGKTRVVTAARHRRDRAKLAVPPNVHRHAYSRRSVYRCGDVLVNERKASFRSLPTRQYRPRHHMLMCWRSPALRWSRRLRNAALNLVDLEWILHRHPPALPSSAAGSGRASARSPGFSPKRLGWSTNWLLGE
jgi:hypothetical protein